MKSLLLFVALLGAIVLSNSFLSVSRASTQGRKQSSITRFDRPVTLQGVVLKGDYLFVHDDDAMARGEACTFVYKGVVASPSHLVASFHCTPVEHKKADHFTVRTVETSPGVFELADFQFSGDTEGHLVPRAK